MRATVAAARDRAGARRTTGWTPPAVSFALRPANNDKNGDGRACTGSPTRRQARDEAVAASAPQINKGVVRVIQNAADTPADASRTSHAPGVTPVADGLRYRRLLEVLGPLDQALVKALDRWSASLATGSTDPRAYVDVAREAESAIKGVLRQMGRAVDADDPDRLLFPAGSPEQVRVARAVRKVAIELGLEAGEVLLGQVAPAGDPMAGLRQRLAELREDQKRLKSERDARMRGPLRATVALRPKYIGALDGPTVTALTAAATAFDTAAATSAPDAGALAAAADHLIDVAQQARTAGARLRESDRQEVVQLADLLQELVAEHLERWPGPLATKAAALRATIPTLPATGESLDRFWSDQKTEVLAMLPSEIAAQVSDAMSLHLGAELGRLTALAPDDAAATEEQAWRVIRILRAYKATAARLPVSRADAKARLHAVLDAVALSVQRLLSPPPDGR